MVNAKVNRQPQHQQQVGSSFGCQLSWRQPAAAARAESSQQLRHAVSLNQSSGLQMTTRLTHRGSAAGEAGPERGTSVGRKGISAQASICFLVIKLIGRGIIAGPVRETVPLLQHSSSPWAAAPACPLAACAAPPSPRRCLQRNSTQAPVGAIQEGAERHVCMSLAHTGRNRDVQVVGTGWQGHCRSARLFRHLGTGSKHSPSAPLKESGNTSRMLKSSGQAGGTCRHAAAVEAEGRSLHEAE